MELINCPNCLSVYGDLQEECPNCRADHAGRGADVELDGATRTVVASLGGLFGGILEGPEDTHLLWCRRGVCLFDERSGLVWGSERLGRVDEVALESGGIRVSVPGRELVLDLADGSVA